MKGKYIYIFFKRVPSNHKTFDNVVLTLVHRRRRWTNVKTILIQRLVSAGYSVLNAAFLNIYWLNYFLRLFQFLKKMEKSSTFKIGPVIMHIKQVIILLHCHCFKIFTPDTP